MDALAEFLHMGGYAFFVWTAYGIATVVLGVNFVKPLLCERQLRRRLARQARLARRHA